MEINNNQSIPNLPEYLYYGQYERTDEIDQRIFERIRSDIPMRPSFDVRGVNTRQCMFPIVPPIQHTVPKVAIQKTPEYNSTKVFSPIQTVGKPIDTFLERIQVESTLRNQYFALQHGAEQSQYIPSSTSDLYKFTVPQNNNLREPNPFVYLKTFTSNNEPSYQTTMNHKLIHSIGKNVFNNPTQQQLRGL